MNEQSIHFAGHLHGIYTQAGAESSEQPVIILINAGLLHSAGPYRLYTELARLLAADGYSTLRFDLSGLGDSLEAAQTDVTGADDSLQYPEALSTEQVLQDLGAAMDLITDRFQARQFVLCGLCSGADDALQMARFDARVKGLVLMDGAGFRTPRFYLHHLLSHYPRRIISFKKWRGLFRRMRSAALESMADASKVDKRSQSLLDETVSYDISMANDGFREAADRQVFRQTVSELAARDCRMLFTFTGGVAHYYNHHGQFKAMIRGVDLSDPPTVKYYPRADHLLFINAHRQQLIADTRAWMRSQCF